MRFSVDFETLYRETGNPLFVWAALADYEQCPDGAPLPAWIMSYLREAAMTLELLADTAPPSKAAKGALGALGLTSQGSNRFSNYKSWLRADVAAGAYDLRKEIIRAGKAEHDVEWIKEAMSAGSASAVRAGISRMRRLRKR